MRRHRRLLLMLAAAAAALLSLMAPATSAGGPGASAPADLREWLSYIASDQLQGRAVFGTGLGLAAAYIDEHLRSWGLQPAGDRGSYFQTVRVLTVKAASHSSLTVRVGNETRTFVDGDGIVFPKQAGAKRHLTISRVEFAGYALNFPTAHHADLGSRDLTDTAVVWLGADGPKDVDAQAKRLLLDQRGSFAVDQAHAAATIGPELRPSDPPPGDEEARFRDQGSRSRTGSPPFDFVTVERLDRPQPPEGSATDAFYEFLFSRAPVRYDELKRRVAAREPLPAFALDGVTLTFNIDVDYTILRTRLTQNVVGIVQGSDRDLKNTYVAFGAHYDHVGYADGEIVPGENGPQRDHAPGRVTSGAIDDRIWNGADDDGSGTVGLMALARAFAAGPRPRRSLLFVWHTGEEAGRYGSLYFTEHPTVPLDRILAQLNIDMIGRNRDDKMSEANTVYLVGADRISTELDATARAANLALPRPMTLDFTFNDLSDRESLYTRSDHYSYASRGIPVIFFTTGLHSDYHANTDDVSKIEFGKLARVVDLVYETGQRLANLDHPLVRNNRTAQRGRPALPLH